MVYKYAQSSGIYEQFQMRNNSSTQNRIRNIIAAVLLLCLASAVKGSSESNTKVGNPVLSTAQEEQTTPTQDSNSIFTKRIGTSTDSNTFSLSKEAENNIKKIEGVIKNALTELKTLVKFPTEIEKIANTMVKKIGYFQDYFYYLFVKAYDSNKSEFKSFIEKLTKPHGLDIILEKIDEMELVELTGVEDSKENLSNTNLSSIDLGITNEFYKVIDAAGDEKAKSFKEYIDPTKLKEEMNKIEREIYNNLRLHSERFKDRRIKVLFFTLIKVLNDKPLNIKLQFAIDKYSSFSEIELLYERLSYINFIINKIKQLGKTY